MLVTRYGDRLGYLNSKRVQRQAQDLIFGGLGIGFCNDWTILQKSLLSQALRQ
ncbi:hypothetical protein [Nostoc sp. MS1]|uniref:hypothetical protein n=1 Tax=Nostoc sp. MS1 TaxID=2764711 RepID=UPI001CC5B7A6|nr:hypothetical protein [Nostoc sp. MS1]